MKHTCGPNCERHDITKPGWSWLGTGKPFWPLDPRPQDVDIRDIAHNLSMQVRYSGNVKWFYSVAQHSVLVSEHCDPVDAFFGLLHDAAEAYLIDLTRPVKHSPTLYPAWKEIEDRVHACVAEAFGFDPERPESVAVADDRVARTEMRDLFEHPRPTNSNLMAHGEPYPERIFPWSQEMAEWAFTQRFNNLVRKTA